MHVRKPVVFNLVLFFLAGYVFAVEKTAPVPVTLENEHVAFVFDASAGYGLTGLIDKKTGRSILDPAGQRTNEPSLWQLVLCNTALEKITIDNHLPSTTTYHLAQEWGKQTLTIEWRNIVHAGRDVGVRVTAKITLPNSSALADFRITVDVENSPYRPWSVAYPTLRGIKDLGDDYLLVPEYWGRIVYDPTKRLRENRLHSPGSFSMQFLAMWGSEQLKFTPPQPLEQEFTAHGWVRGPADDECGIFLMSADGDGWFKEATTGRSGKDEFVRMQVSHFPAIETWPVPAHNTVSYTVPYPMLLGVFNGTAETACDLYRAWALKQKWASRGPIWDPKGPEWKRISDYVRDNVFWGKFYHEPAKAVAELALYREFLHVPVMTHYYRYYISRFDDNNPEYLPSDPYFREGVRDLRAMGIGVMPYVCAAVWDMDVESYRLENAIQGAATEANGQQNTWLLAGNSPSIWMDPSSPLWQKKMREVGDKLIGDYGVNGLYLDVLAMEGKLSYNSKIHPVHGGTYWAEGNRKLIEGLKRSAQERQPRMMLSTEGFCETYIDLLDAFLTLDISRFGWNYATGYDIFPVLPMVYHEYMINFGSDCSSALPMDLLAWQMGLTYVWGSQPTYSAMVINRPEQTPEQSAFLKEITSSFHQAGRKFLTGGRWIQTATVPSMAFGGTAPVTVVCAEHSVTITSANKKKWPWIGPAVLASAYKAADGATGIVLVNITGREQPIEIKLDTRKMDIGRQSLWQAWPLPGQALGKIVGPSHTISVRVAPRGVAIYEINSKVPIALPLQEFAWQFVSAQKDGTFETITRESAALWGCEDTPVRNELVQGKNTLTVLTSAISGTGYAPKKLDTIVEWGTSEGSGKPRAPRDKPFHLLRETEYRVAGGEVRADVQFAYGVLSAVAKSGGPFSIEGTQSTRLFGYSAEKNVLIRKAKVASLDGEYEIVGFDKDEATRRLKAIQMEEADDVQETIKALAEKNGLLAGRITAFTTSADRFIGKSSSLLFTEELREAGLFVAQLSCELTALLQRITVVPELKNDWLVPGRTLSVPVRISSRGGTVTVLSADLLCPNGALAGAIKTSVDGKGQTVIPVGGSAVVNFNVCCDSEQFVERLLPLYVRLKTQDTGKNVSVSLVPLWLNIDRPLMAKAPMDAVSALPGTTASVKINLKNVSPHDLKLRPRFVTPQGCVIQEECTKPFSLTALAEMDFALSFRLAEGDTNSSHEIDCFFDYSDGECFTVHEKVIVEVVPSFAPLSEKPGGAGLAGIEKLRCRFKTTLVLFAAKDDPLAVEVASTPLVGNADKVACRVLSGSMKVLKEGAIQSGTTGKIVIPAGAPACYFVELSCPRTYTIKSVSAMAGGILSTERSPLTLNGGGESSFYFYILPDARSFEITGRDGGPSETARIDILDTAGKVVFTRGGNWNGTWYTVPVLPGADNAIWQIKVRPVEDIKVQVRGGISPCMSISKQSVLKR